MFRLEEDTLFVQLPEVKTQLELVEDCKSEIKKV